MAPGKMIMLEIGGQLVTVMVEREQLADLVASEYPANRSVYVITWDDGQVDDDSPSHSSSPPLSD
jgi:hypothetical protein